jgi:hypothetical protein
MPYISSVEKVSMQMGLLRGIEACLKLKFGAAGLELMPEIREIRDHQVLDKVLTRIEAVDSPAALRRVWTRKRRPKAAKRD